MVRSVLRCGGRTRLDRPRAGVTPLGCAVPLRRLATAWVALNVVACAGHGPPSTAPTAAPNPQHDSSQLVPATTVASIAAQSDTLPRRPVSTSATPGRFYTNRSYGSDAQFNPLT